MAQIKEGGKNTKQSNSNLAFLDEINVLTPQEKNIYRENVSATPSGSLICPLCKKEGFEICQQHANKTKIGQWCCTNCNKRYSRASRLDETLNPSVETLQEEPIETENAKPLPVDQLTKGVPRMTVDKKIVALLKANYDFYVDPKGWVYGKRIHDSELILPDGCDPSCVENFELQMPPREVSFVSPDILKMQSVRLAPLFSVNDIPQFKLPYHAALIAADKKSFSDPELELPTDKRNGEYIFTTCPKRKKRIDTAKKRVERDGLHELVSKSIAKVKCEDDVRRIVFDLMQDFGLNFFGDDGEYHGKTLMSLAYFAIAHRVRGFVPALKGKHFAVILTQIEGVGKTELTNLFANESYFNEGVNEGVGFGHLTAMRRHVVDDDKYLQASKDCDLFELADGSLTGKVFIDRLNAFVTSAELQGNKKYKVDFELALVDTTVMVTTTDATFQALGGKGKGRRAIPIPLKSFIEDGIAVDEQEKRKHLVCQWLAVTTLVVFDALKRGFSPDKLLDTQGTFLPLRPLEWRYKILKSTDSDIQETIEDILGDNDNVRFTNSMDLYDMIRRKMHDLKINNREITGALATMGYRNTDKSGNPYKHNSGKRYWIKGKDARWKDFTDITERFSG